MLWWFDIQPTRMDRISLIMNSSICIEKKRGRGKKREKETHNWNGTSNTFYIDGTAWFQMTLWVQVQVGLNKPNGYTDHFRLMVYSELILFVHFVSLLKKLAVLTDYGWLLASPLVGNNEIRATDICAYIKQLVQL